MIKAAELYKHPLIVNTFGASRAFETARVLREQGLFPKHLALSIRETARFLYCLAAGSGMQVHENAERAVNELAEVYDRRGELFIDHLEELLRDERLIRVVQEIGINQRLPICWIRSNSGDINIYQAERKFSISVSLVTILYPDFLSAYAGVIKGRTIKYEYQN